MKKILCWLIMSLILFTSCGALAEFVLPTPVPSTTAEPGTEEKYDITAQTEKKELVLPSPTYSFISTYEFKKDFFQAGEVVLDAYIFSIYNAGDAISNYLTACQEAGFVWDLSDIFVGYLAYSISGDGYVAYLIPDYGENLLVLVQSGMPIGEDKAAPEAYEKNKLLLNVNGTVCQLDFDTYWKGGTAYFKRNSEYPFGFYLTMTDGSQFKGKNFVFTSSSTPYQLVIVTVPNDVKTAAKYRATKGTQNKLSCVILRDASIESIFVRSKNDPVANIYYDDTYSVEKSTEGLSTDKDYFEIQMIYINGNEYRGRFEGSFNNGKDIVSGTFWAVK